MRYTQSGCKTGMGNRINKPLCSRNILCAATCLIIESLYKTASL
ncbi:hypothetical protein NEICINOT_04719 [Neisseria cinerea ATCC 14685]|uniref:Uncharacterized protein n=1 Tax=Neisseria cinerea ATCC 14685 TaxID=546262 RepID=D0W4X1_NEICI|nr:hypothetical protein NEICINOT_04719 [Neisseria cinerea ATCC 14685]